MKATLVLFVIMLQLVSPLLAQPADSTFQESDIVLHTESGDIFGTLTMPVGVKHPPVVLIVAGSGPTDRNGNSTMGIKPESYRMLAHAMAKEGIASVRYDKRGIAASMGAASSEADLTFDTYITDVVWWVEMLKEENKYSKIWIAGHSEGSMIGVIAANRTGLDGLISIAGPGRPIDAVLKEQLSKQLTPELMLESNQILDSLKSGHKVNKVSPVLTMLYRPSIQPYMISWLKYDPAIEIGKLKIPVLIIQGETDIQVTVEDARMLKAGNESAALVIIPEMNHVLKKAPADQTANMATYYQPELPLVEEFVSAVLKFVKGH